MRMKRFGSLDSSKPVSRRAWRKANKEKKFRCLRRCYYQSQLIEEAANRIELTLQMSATIRLRWLWAMRNSSAARHSLFHWLFICWKRASLLMMLWGESARNAIESRSVSISASSWEGILLTPLNKSTFVRKCRVQSISSTREYDRRKRTSNTASCFNSATMIRCWCLKNSLSG